MKNLLKLNIFGLLLLSAGISACTLSTTGLRPPTDHSLAFGAINEVYDKPATAEEPSH